MYIKSLSLKDFRNISEINIELSEKTNILYGDNGQGKTNILESIYISSMGRSQKTRTENHLIKKDIIYIWHKNPLDERTNVRHNR